jgi:hypothetical protein
MFLLSHIPSLRWIDALSVAWTYVRCNPYEPRLHLVDAYWVFADSLRIGTNGAQHVERRDAGAARVKPDKPHHVNPGGQLREGSFTISRISTLSGRGCRGIVRLRVC